MLGISIDITDIKNMQEQLERQNVELRELDEMKNRFISTISHELRTPITSFRGYLEIIEDQKAELPKDVQRYIEILERNTTRLVTLTDDLLDQQRIQTGRLQINTQTVDINKIILDSVNEVKIFTDTKDIKIETTTQEDIPQIQADPVRVQQILVNLLHNAFKFSQENSTITVTETHDDDFVHISVLDKGVGLTEKQLSMLFKPFPGIVHDSNIMGTGLGLSICRGLIELHKGRIWAESEGLGKGTSFHFMLPVKG
jgi:signal transduction histidine kinase